MLNSPVFYCVCSLEVVVVIVIVVVVVFDVEGDAAAAPRLDQRIGAHLKAYTAIGKHAKQA